MPEFNFRALLDMPEIAGIAGSLAGLKLAPGDTWQEKAFNFLVGCGFAIFAAPALCELSGVSSKAMQSGMAFVMGYAGMSLGAALLQSALQRIQETKFGDLLNSIFGRKPQ